MAHKDPSKRDVELGEEITQDVQRRRGGGIVLSVRLSSDETTRLQALARSSGKSISEVAREALRSSLSNRGLHVLPDELTATASGGASLTIFSAITQSTTAAMPIMQREPTAPYVTG